MTRFRLSTFIVVSVLGVLLLAHLPAAAKESWSWAQNSAQSTIEPWTSFETQESLASTADIDWNQTPNYLHYMREEDGVFPKDTDPRDFSGVWRGQPPRQGLEDMRHGRPDETPASAQLNLARAGDPSSLSNIQSGRPGSGGLDVTPDLLPGEEIVLTPLGAELYREVVASYGPRSDCIPYGPIRPLSNNSPKEFVMTEDQIVILAEMHTEVVRQIFMDGRPHSELGVAFAAWNGQSVGRWEGATLVVETFGVNDRVWIDSAGLPASNQLHLIDRFRKLDDNTMLWAVTVNDPVYYQKPWTFERFLYRDEVNELRPKICHDFEMGAETPMIWVPHHRIQPVMP